MFGIIIYNEKSFYKDDKEKKDETETCYAVNS